MKHLSRCNILLHIVDINSTDAVAENILQIERELAGYSSELAAKKTWLVFNKCDSISPEDVDDIIRKCLVDLNREGADYSKISAISGEGVSNLIINVANDLFPQD